MPRDLFKLVDDEDVKDNKKIEVNKKYAEHLEKHRLQEEYQKLKNKYKDEVISDDEDEDHFLSDVDDSPDEIKRYVEHLLMVKNNDPKLKDPNYKYIMKPPQKKVEKNHQNKASSTKSIKSKAKSIWNDDDDHDEDDNGATEKPEENMDNGLEDWQKELYRKANLDQMEEDDQFLLRFFVEKLYRGKGKEEDYDFGDLSEEERYEEEARDYERHYNFRFEHPDSGQLAAIPRKVEDCVAPKESKRKRQREEKKKRKQEMLLKKKEEVKRLKALKRKEIEDKLNQIKTAAGADFELDEDALEGDYDPEEHDKMMQKVFNEEYDQVEEENLPEFALDEEDDEVTNYDDWTGRESSLPQEQDGEESIEPQPSTSSGIGAAKKKKKKSLFWENLNKEKPKFDPTSGKTFDKYLEEYYQLDFEDIVGGKPTRFKYREVAPNDFGLTTEEILAAKEEELNRWARLRKVLMIRTDNDEKNYNVAYKQKAMIPGKKEKIFKSLYSKEADENPNLEPPKKKQRKHSKRQKQQLEV